jgi:hypothetical protein
LTVPASWTKLEQTLYCEQIRWNCYRTSPTQTVLVSTTNPYAIVYYNHHVKKSATYTGKVGGTALGLRYRSEDAALRACSLHLHSIKAYLHANLDD